MTKTTISYETDQTSIRCQAMVSLHGHTLHSRETLVFINRLARNFAPLGAALKHGGARYRSFHATDLDLNRAWWTPRLAPHAAWLLESCSIDRKYGVKPLVSLTDHDNIEAPVTLRILSECSDVPVSVEWTVPFNNTFFHLGVHNIPPSSARPIILELNEYTANPDASHLGGLLESITAIPGVLVVFNHPCWDEQGIGPQSHMDCARRFAARFALYLHAFELNGLRPWSENRAAIAFAHSRGKPVISGGDRHALEPSTVLNPTNAGSFDEFVDEVRSGYSHVLVTASYFEAFTLRILHTLEQILRDNHSHGLGWVRWDDRVFYLCDDGVVRSLAELWNRRAPSLVRLFVGSVRLLAAPAVAVAVRNILAYRRIPRAVQEGT